MSSTTTTATTTTNDRTNDRMTPQQQAAAREMVEAWGAAVDALRDAEDALSRLTDAIDEMVPGDYPRWLPSRDEREIARRDAMGLELVIESIRGNLSSLEPCSMSRTDDVMTDRASVIITNHQRAELGLPPIGQEEAAVA